MSKFDVFSRQKHLIVITGMSGTGKTSLAKKLSDTFDIPYLSLNYYKSEASRKYGFSGYYEKDMIFDIAKLKFRTDIIANVSLGTPLIIEASFEDDWQKLLNYVAEKYKYKISIINCNTKTFEEVWDNITAINKENDYNVAIEFINGRCAKIDSYYMTDEYKNLYEQLYRESYFNKLVGDFDFSDSEIYEAFLNVDIT